MFQQLVSLILVVAMVLVPQASFAQSPQISRPTRSRTSDTVAFRATAALPFCQATQRSMLESIGFLVSSQNDSPRFGLRPEMKMASEDVIENARQQREVVIKQIEAWGIACSPVFDRVLAPLAEQASNRGSFVVNVGGQRQAFSSPPTPAQLLRFAEVNPQLNERVMFVLSESRGQYPGLQTWTSDLAKFLRDEPGGGVIFDPSSQGSALFSDKTIAALALVATVGGVICAASGGTFTAPSCAVSAAAGLFAAGAAFANVVVKN